jgi:hypothetical protein
MPQNAPLLSDYAQTEAATGHFSTAHLAERSQLFLLFFARALSSNQLD